jgi:hypothetical protein
MKPPIGKQDDELWEQYTEVLWRLILVPKEYAEAIGWVINLSTWIEYAIVNFIIRLSFGDESVENRRIIESLIGGENFEILLAKLEKVFRIRVKDSVLNSKFKTITNAIREANSDRGKYIHSHWITNINLRHYLSSLPDRIEAVKHDPAAVQALAEQMKADADCFAREAKVLPIRTRLKRQMDKQTNSMREIEDKVPLDDLVEAGKKARKVLRDLFAFMGETYKYLHLHKLGKF